MHFSFNTVALIVVNTLLAPAMAADFAQAPVDAVQKLRAGETLEYYLAYMDYDLELAQTEEESDIILGFDIQADGSVDPASVVVHKSTGELALDKSAAGRAATWKFIPQSNGHNSRIAFVFCPTHRKAGCGILASSPR